MKALNKAWLVLFYIVFSLGATFFYIAGIIHAYKKHPTFDFVLSIILPPFGIYRGAEMFWHKEIDTVTQHLPVNRLPANTVAFRSY
jgi:hypothetical protein